MNPFAHFEDQFGHLQLSDNDAALHVFLAGWNSAMMEMMQRVNKMPFQNDTRASFAVYFQSQMVNVEAIEKPVQQSTKRVEPVATDGKWYWVRYEGLGKTYEAPALYRESAKAFYSVEFSGIPAQQVEVLCEYPPAQRKPLTITEESAWDLARYVYARSNPHESPQILLSAMEIKQIIEAAHGIKGGE
jgi:hypothetical protein